MTQEKTQKHVPERVVRAAMKTIASLSDEQWAEIISHFPDRHAAGEIAERVRLGCRTLTAEEPKG